MFVRIDGKVNQKDRNAAINLFRTDSSIRVMLLSISCGAVGYVENVSYIQSSSLFYERFGLTFSGHSLDLTVASRVFLMEPQWNPMIEEQALDRVYRIGQTKHVTTVRYIVKDSFEEVNNL